MNPVKKVSRPGRYPFSPCIRIVGRHLCRFSSWPSDPGCIHLLSPRRSGRGLIGGKVRRGGSSAAVAEGGPYSDDSSRYERPANYAPNGEQIDAASRHEPGIIRGKGAVFPSSPTQGSQERRGPFPGLSCKFVCDVPGSPEGRVKRHKLVGGDAGGARSPPRQRIAVAVCVAKSQSVLAQPPDRKL